MRTGGAQLPSESAHCAWGASNVTAPVGGAFTPAAATRIASSSYSKCANQERPRLLDGEPAARSGQGPWEGPGKRREGGAHGRPARAFSAASSRGAGGGWASRIIAALMPAAGGGRGGRRAGGEAGRGVSGRPPARAFPPPLRAAATRRGSSDRAPVPPARSSPRPRSPQPAGARCSPCRSRPATGFKVGAAPRSPHPAPARPPGAPSRVSGRARCAPARPPPPVRTAGCGLPRAGSGRGPGDPRFPPPLCLPQEGRRSACSKPGRSGGWPRSTG